MIECKKCKKQYIGETKRSLRERFTEHRQATNNSDHASAQAAVPTHFNLPSHSVRDMLLIPLELQVTNSPSRRKAREAHFIQRGQTSTPYGITTDEMNANFGRFIYCNCNLFTDIFSLQLCAIRLFFFCTIYFKLPTSSTLTAIVYLNSNLEPLFSLY